MARYLISEAARQTGVEAHVLRFWEEELRLEIPRNEQGHRCYTEEHIRIFEKIKHMKLQGFQLKAIKEAIDGADGGEAAPQETEIHEQPVEKNISIPIRFAEKRQGELSGTDKLMEFESIVYDIVTEALRNNNDRQVKEISDRVGDKVVKEMNYLMRENEAHLEEHFRKLDEVLCLRGRRPKGAHQKEAAATKVTSLSALSPAKKRRRWFPRKRKTTLYS